MTEQSQTEGGRWGGGDRGCDRAEPDRGRQRRGTEGVTEQSQTEGGRGGGGGGGQKR